MCPGRAVKASGERGADKWLRIAHGEVDRVIGLLLIPAVLDALDPDQVQAIGDFARRQSGLGEAWKAALQAAPRAFSFSGVSGSSMAAELTGLAA